MFKRIALVVLLFVFAALSVSSVLAQAPGVTESGAEANGATNSGMIIGIWHLHSAVRWLVVIITVALLIKLVMGLVSGGEFDSLARNLTRAFSISVGVQWLLGVVLFLVWGGFDVRYRWEHAIVMTVAVALAGMTARWKNAPDSQRYRMTLLMVVIVLVLVYVGVAVLPQGWRAMPVTA